MNRPRTNLRMLPTAAAAWVALVALAALLAAGRATAQLAITEVLSAPEFTADPARRGPEYWELTNFGPGDVPLDGYGFRDADQAHDLARAPFAQLVIRSGESIVFFRWQSSSQSVTNLAQFRAWWGDSRLPRDLQVRSYPAPGLGGWDGDGVRLFDPAGRLVDSVDFARARLGRSFVYDGQTGHFGAISVAGVGGAWAAELTGDVGSPGVTTGPVPIQILQAPADAVVDAGSMASFSVMAGGCPRPGYQWFFQDQPLPWANEPDLRLTDLQPAQAGLYRVALTNGLAGVVSAAATLQVRTDPTPATLVQPPGDLAVFVGQTAVFTVVARGLPGVSYAWRTNGGLVPNQTGPRLEIADARLAQSGLRWAVTVSNALGTAEASAVLTVTERQDLRV